MPAKIVRTLTLTLLLGAVLLLSTPSAAQARTFDLEERITVRLMEVVHDGGRALSSAWSDLTRWIATSTATICGDG